MILKFREAHISNLEKAKQSDPVSATDQDTVVVSWYNVYLYPHQLLNALIQSLLRQEIDQLKYMVQHHPEVTKMVRENLNLKAEIKRMQKLTTGEGSKLSRELARAHKYTLQLERQLRHYLARGGKYKLNSYP